MLCLGSFTWLEESRKERRGLVWIIHAATVVHQSSWVPPDACPPDSLFLSWLHLFICTLCLFCHLCEFLRVSLFNNFRTAAVFIAHSHRFLDESMLLLVFQSISQNMAKVSLLIIVFPVIKLLSVTFIICMNLAFLRGLGVSGSYFSGGCDCYLPTPHHVSLQMRLQHMCVCACVPVCVTGGFTCSNDEGSGWGQGLSAPLMRERGPACSLGPEQRIGE